MKTHQAISDSEPIVEEAQGINIQLLLKVADFIESHPKKFDMNMWRGEEMKDKPNPWYRRALGLPAPQERCGTTYCIAGWTVHLAGGDMQGNLPASAQRLLGLTLEQSTRLFYEHHWPKRFRGAAEVPVDRSWFASARIRHFIATDGAE